MRACRVALLFLLLAAPLFAQDEPFEGRVVVKSTSPKSVVVFVDTNPVDGRLNKAFRVRADNPFADQASYSFEKAKVVVTDKEVAIVADAEKLVIALTTMEDKPSAPPAGYKLVHYAGYEVARELGPFTDPMPKKAEEAAELAKQIFGD